MTEYRYLVFRNTGLPAQERSLWMTKPDVEELTIRYVKSSDPEKLTALQLCEMTCVPTGETVHYDGRTAEIWIPKERN